MPIEPTPAIPLYGHLHRARQIARSWKLLDHLPPADAEIVVRAIAQGIAEGRRYGAELAKVDAQGRDEMSSIPDLEAAFTG